MSLRLRPFHPPTRVLGPFGPKVRNGVENEFPGPSGPGLQKVKKRVEKSQKSGNFNSFSTFLTLFRLIFNFLGPGPGRPRELIFNSVSNFGPEGPKNSSGGMEGSQP